MMSAVTLFSWGAQIAYTFCLMPQVVTNYRVKSGTGMSEFLLIGYLNLLSFGMFYVFLLDLPMAYKVCVPIQLACVLIMIVQRLWYDSAPLAKRLAMFYLSNLAVVIAVIPYAMANPAAIGSLGGWGNVAFGFFSQGAQVITLWHRKSVAGFNITFVYACLTGGIIELIGALVGALPVQTKVSALRVISLCSVFLVQFKLYAKRHVKPR
jgi:hypothetical protein